MSCWLKHGSLSVFEITTVISKTDKPHTWIIITEPWCGDAAYIVPFLNLIALKNPLITVDYELRDSEPFRINAYLTSGGKSIPKLIVRNLLGQDLFTWGP